MIDGEYVALTGDDAVNCGLPDAMRVVYDHGKLCVFDDFETIRERAKILVEDE